MTRLGRSRQLRFERLRQSVIDGPGHLDPRQRRAAFHRQLDALPDASRAFAAKVHDHAYRITDGDVQGLLAAGYSEDEVFELTTAAAVGAGLSRLERACRALDGG